MNGAAAYINNFIHHFDRNKIHLAFVQMSIKIYSGLSSIPLLQISQKLQDAPQSVSQQLTNLLKRERKS